MQYCKTCWPVFPPLHHVHRSLNGLQSLRKGDLQYPFSSALSAPVNCSFGPEATGPLKGERTWLPSLQRWVPPANHWQVAQHHAMLCPAVWSVTDWSNRDPAQTCPPTSENGLGIKSGGLLCLVCLSPPQAQKCPVTFPSAEVLVLQVVAVHLEAPEEAVLLGDAGAVGEDGAQGAAQGPGRREQPRPQLLRLHGQRGILLCPEKAVNYTCPEQGQPSRSQGK